MKEWLFLLTVPLLVLIGNLLMKWIDAALTRRTEARKEKQEREEKLDTSLLEYRKNQENKDLELVRIVMARSQSLEASSDETRNRIEQVLMKENERLHQENQRVAKENFHLRETLTNAIMGLRSLEDEGSPEVKELAGRLASQVMEDDC